MIYSNDSFDINDSLDSTPLASTNNSTTNKKDVIDINDFINLNKKTLNNPKFAYLNINHLRNKVVDLRYILKDIDQTFLAISETKLDDSFPNAQFNINGLSKCQRV